MPQRVLDVLAYEKGSRRVISDVWWAIPLRLLWLIWKEYDRRAFEDVERPLMELKPFFLGLCMSG